ncbi:N(2)-acetyl-L-2,4-diaminobutanoate deacetylase DoeB2 [Catenovulum adriaticum]|uniref:N(2)-acetyl-L-2,4-diaminobutanoate deacetylase DoeB2 n=1 Tax=Catenovulum adriaticum TaxID=2984846 RepID=A0ABY7AL05_9ALTE|nr:N(2)-acetyl-L-2,4-diaminobutanoate deacetylase DoeB2 [Catenovulum sp. TS8]WAJ69417.1 N(2)-acetyl-L-2,4-diaminobutanoate deacetylase DoeB2 [Catenovulum sp. TS8]
MSSNWQDIIDSATETRKALHQSPELSWQETQTASLIREKLNQLDIPWQSYAQTGTLACINPSAKGNGHPHIALRGDIDALPISEKTDKAWQSKTDGCMHACGHDGHTATLLATAEWLKLNEAEIPGAVSLVFQPAEEGGHGAREMLKDGALKEVDYIYGWHNWPAIPFGQLLCPDDIVMCGNGTFEVIITGKGGHASQPELCADPVLAASAINLALQQIISRKLAPQQAAVVSVTSIQAESGLTVIPQQAKLSGCIRVPNQETADTINQLIEQISHDTAKAYGTECQVNIYPRYSATINHKTHAQRVREEWQNLYGKDSLAQNVNVPIMASEDFSYYLNAIPGAFALIGADDGENHDAPCHSPNYDFNDKLIALVTQLFSRIVGAPVPNLTKS